MYDRGPNPSGPWVDPTPEGVRTLPRTCPPPRAPGRYPSPACPPLPPRGPDPSRGHARHLEQRSDPPPLHGRHTPGGVGTLGGTADRRDRQVDADARAPARLRRQLDPTPQRPD